jgi:hypothetical protein
LLSLFRYCVCVLMFFGVGMVVFLACSMCCFFI